MYGKMPVNTEWKRRVGLIYPLEKRQRDTQMTAADYRDKNRKIYEQLTVEKDSITKYNNNVNMNSTHSWDKIKRFSNEYEYIYTTSSLPEFKNQAKTNPISRSYFKLWEIIKDNPDLIPPYASDPYGIKTAHIAEGPGGFIECMCNYLYEFIGEDSCNAAKMEMHGVTLQSDNKNIPNWRIKQQMITDFNIYLNHLGDKCTDGDLYNMDNISAFIEITIGTSGRCNFVTADGGFDFSDNFNSQETDFIIFFISELYIILKVLKNGGNAVIKIYDTLSHYSVICMYILYRLFTRVVIEKPLSSRPANSEKYIICKGYKLDNSKDIDEFLSVFERTISEKSVKPLDDLFTMTSEGGGDGEGDQNRDRETMSICTIPFWFYHTITEYNHIATKRQINYIRKTLTLIEKLVSMDRNATGRRKFGNSKNTAANSNSNVFSYNNRNHRSAAKYLKHNGYANNERDSYKHHHHHYNNNKPNKQGGDLLRTMYEKNITYCEEWCRYYDIK